MGLADIKKQLAALAQPFEDLRRAAFELQSNIATIQGAAADVAKGVNVGSDSPQGLARVYKHVREFDQNLIAFQTAVRAAMASAVMDEWLAEKKRLGHLNENGDL